MTKRSSIRKTLAATSMALAVVGCGVLPAAMAAPDNQEAVAAIEYTPMNSPEVYNIDEDAILYVGGQLSSHTDEVGNQYEGTATLYLSGVPYSNGIELTHLEQIDADGRPGLDSVIVPAGTVPQGVYTLVVTSSIISAGGTEAISGSWPVSDNIVFTNGEDPVGETFDVTEEAVQAITMPVAEATDEEPVKAITMPDETHVASETATPTMEATPEPTTTATATAEATATTEPQVTTPEPSAAVTTTAAEAPVATATAEPSQPATVAPQVNTQEVEKQAEPQQPTIQETTTAQVETQDDTAVETVAHVQAATGNGTPETPKATELAAPSNAANNQAYNQIKENTLNNNETKKDVETSNVSNNKTEAADTASNATVKMPSRGVFLIGAMACAALAGVLYLVASKESKNKVKKMLFGTK